MLAFPRSRLLAGSASVLIENDLASELIKRGGFGAAVPDLPIEIVRFRYVGCDGEAQTLKDAHSSEATQGTVTKAALREHLGVDPYLVSSSPAETKLFDVLLMWGTGLASWLNARRCCEGLLCRAGLLERVTEDTLPRCKTQRFIFLVI